MNWETWSYFRWILSSTGVLTYGKIYKIHDNDGISIHFFDDTGHVRRWYFPIIGVKNVSFEENLKKILE